MLLPQSLLRAIDRVTQSVDHKRLYKSAEELSFRYRNPSPHSQKFIQTEEECLAYLCTRLPATFAANYYVFSEIIKQGLEKDISSILDLGSGSGAALWAASEIFKTLNTYTLLERDARLIAIGKELIKESEVSFSSEWLLGDYTTSIDTDPHDLVVISYSLGEVDSKKWEQVLSVAIKQTKKLLVILEPGTPLGYKKLMKMREFLIRQNLYMVAPCPHNKPCPMTEKQWCHFSQRLPRTTLHKNLKNATLGFEDEKFSYIILSKQPYIKEGYRIINTPLRRSGYIELDVCSTFDGLLKQKTSKKEKSFFDRVKKLEWGSFYDYEA